MEVNVKAYLHKKILLQELELLEKNRNYYIDEFEKSILCDFPTYTNGRNDAELIIDERIEKIKKELNN